MNISRENIFTTLGCLLLFGWLIPSDSLGAPAVVTTNQFSLKRYLVFTQAGAEAAVALGARVVRETRGLKAVVCPQALAERLGLMEDIPVQALDSAANNEV